jgi:hypothetical protein
MHGKPSGYVSIGEALPNTVLQIAVQNEAMQAARTRVEDFLLFLSGVTSVPEVTRLLDDDDRFMLSMAFDVYSLGYKELEIDLPEGVTPSDFPVAHAIAHIWAHQPKHN